MAEPNLTLRERWALIVEFAFPGSQETGRAAVRVSEAIAAWNSDTPLLRGKHALHWYQARLGITPWQNCTWDPAVYGGYLATPWWNASGRLASLWTLVEPSWRAYKLGLLLTVCLLPLLWWWSARMLGLGTAAAGVSTWLCVAAFWSGPGVFALNAGELDLLIASGIVPFLVSSWSAWQKQHRLSAAWLAAISLILLGWAYPAAGIAMLLLGAVWYLWMAAHQSAWWHLFTASLALLVAASYYPMIRSACETWWLMDGRWPEECSSIWVSLPVLRLGDWFGLAALLGSALLGVRQCPDGCSGPIWAFALAGCMLAGACPTLPCPAEWQPQRCAELVWPMLIIVGVSGALSLTRQRTNVRGHPGTSRGLAACWLARITALGLLFGLGYAVIGSEMLQRIWGWERLNSAGQRGMPKPYEFEQQKFAEQFRLLQDWLEHYTTLEAAIAVEEDDEFLTWSPCLIAASGRMFVNGLAREVPWAFYEFRLRQEDIGRTPSARSGPMAIEQNTSPCLNRQPLDHWPQEELSELLDRWNVGWLLVRRPEIVQRFLRLRGTQVVAQDAPSGWWLLARPAPGYFVQGQGRLLRLEPGSLTLADLNPTQGRCLLRLVYLPGLVTSCHRCRLESAALAGNAFPCWALVCSVPQTRLTVRYLSGGEGPQ